MSCRAGNRRQRTVLAKLPMARRPRAAPNGSSRSADRVQRVAASFARQFVRRRPMWFSRAPSELPSRPAHRCRLPSQLAVGQVVCRDGEPRPSHENGGATVAQDRRTAAAKAWQRQLVRFIGVDLPQPGAGAGLVAGQSPGDPVSNELAVGDARRCPRAGSELTAIFGPGIRIAPCSFPVEASRATTSSTSLPGREA